MADFIKIEPVIVYLISNATKSNEGFAMDKCTSLLYIIVW